MSKTLKGLLVAGVPATLGILFGVGVIVWGVNDTHKKAAEATANEEQKPAQQGNATDSSAGGKDMKAFVTQNCSTCHGQDLKGKVGPSLIDAGHKLSEEEIVQILKNGKGTMMPAGLAKGQEADVAKFLKTLK